MSSVCVWFQFISTGVFWMCVFLRIVFCTAFVCRGGTLQDIFGIFRAGASFSTAGCLIQTTFKWTNYSCTLYWNRYCQCIGFANYDGWNVLAVWRYRLMLRFEITWTWLCGHVVAVSQLRGSADCFLCLISIHTSWPSINPQTDFFFFLPAFSTLSGQLRGKKNRKF